MTFRTGYRGAKFEQNVWWFSLRKTTDIIYCELVLLALPIFLLQVKLLWALRITEIDLHYAVDFGLDAGLDPRLDSGL